MALLAVFAGAQTPPVAQRALGAPAQAARAAGTGDAGPFYALVIGIQEYPGFKGTPLTTPLNDAHEVATLLRDNYGFNVQELPNAKRSQILDALDRYRDVLHEDANFLLYYAGHGQEDKAADTVYWLPSDAAADSSSNWISVYDITSKIRALPARHVLVVADSCYAGAMRTVHALDAGMANIAARRSRTLLSSGGDEPVADRGAAGHSIFAHELLEALRNPVTATFTGHELFDHLRRPVAGQSAQVPAYQPIANSGDQEGDFVFVSKGAVAADATGKGNAKGGQPTGVTASEAALSAEASADDFQINKKYAAAVPLYNQACDEGIAVACRHLGALYDNGEGVAKDAARAIGLYKQACDGGDASGCRNLGLMYSNGIGVAKNAGRAVELFKRGCDGGNALGCSSLGWMYDNGDGVAKDAGRAAELYRQACDGGDAAGCTNLGGKYENGRGVAKDTARAAEFYEEGCDGGDARGCRDEAMIYHSGSGVAVDAGRILELYKQACNGGDAVGCTNLGSIYEKGIVVPRDAEGAVELYKQGCDRGDTMGCTSLGRMYKDGDGVAKDALRAAELYKKACDGGEPAGCEDLGSMYENGSGLAKDIALALQAYKKACDGGFARDCDNYRRLGGQVR